MQLETVQFEVTDRIATITLNRPDKLNAMNQRTKEDLRACWSRVREDSDIRAAIITSG